MNKRKGVALLGFLMGAGMLVLQLFLTISLRMADGDTLIQAIVHYFGFLTYLANLGIVLVYAAEIFSWRTLKWFSKPQVEASALATIVLVALFYHFILKATLTPPEGIEIYTDLIKHYLAPALFVLWWAFWPAGGKLRLADLPLVAIPGIAYPVYVFLRGALINDYPYTVIDVRPAGYGPALAYAAVVVVGFTLLCIIVIGVERLIGRLKTRGTTSQ